MTDIIKRVKFDDQRLNQFFQMLNENKFIRSIASPYFGYQSIYPLTAIKFNNPSKLNELKAAKANAMMVIDAGHVYDTYPDGPAKTDEQRIQEASPKIEKLYDELNLILDTSTDPLFSQLQAEIVNESYQVTVVKADRGDDGDDQFGIDVYLKFSYK